MTFLSILSLIISIGIPLAALIGRQWIVAFISTRVEHQFETKIEKLRAELRKSEQSFISELRQKESEIATLRETLLSGSAGRQALLDKRRFEAVEKVWTAVNDVGRLKGLAAMMARLNFKAMAEDVNDPRMSQFLSMIGRIAPDIDSLKNVAINERPFLPELAWAYFAAYTSILYGSLLRFNVLKSGVSSADRYLNNEPIRKIMRAALPHQNEFIEGQEPEAYYFLLEEIEDHLLSELRKILEGREADRLAASRAKEIMDAVNGAEKEREKDLINGG